MRNLFLLALLLNIIVFFWQYTRPDTQGQFLMSVDPGVNRLILLNELAPVEEISAVDVRQDEQMPTEAIVEVMDPGEDAVGKEEVDVAVENGADDGTDSGITAIGVQENPAGDAGAVADAISATEPGEPASSCFRLGPLSSSAKAELAEALFIKRGMSVDVVPHDTVEERYWVMLPAYSSFDEAQQAVSRLRQEGVRDLQLLVESGKKNAISLGLYKVKVIADLRMKQMEKLGYKPLMDVIPRKHTVYWLDFELSQGESLPDEISQGVLRMQEVRQEGRECK